VEKVQIYLLHQVVNKVTALISKRNFHLAVMATGSEFGARLKKKLTWNVIRE
jgi:hypothetical protein